LSHTGLIKLDKNYFKTHWKELVEEYLQAVPSLTISNEERQKITITRLRKEKSELEEKTNRIDDLERRLRIMEKTKTKFV
ncbi:MAG: integrase, partial [Patescibacteria group bacterium]|nr:integrase [Patescibacteria group bacterium]